MSSRGRAALTGVSWKGCRSKDVPASAWTKRALVVFIDVCAGIEPGPCGKVPLPQLHAGLRRKPGIGDLNGRITPEARPSNEPGRQQFGKERFVSSHFGQAKTWARLTIVGHRPEQTLCIFANTHTISLCFFVPGLLAAGCCVILADKP